MFCKQQIVVSARIGFTPSHAYFTIDVFIAEMFDTQVRVTQNVGCNRHRRQQRKPETVGDHLHQGVQTIALIDDIGCLGL